MKRTSGTLILLLVLGFVPVTAAHSAIGRGVGVVQNNLFIHWDFGNAFSFDGNQARDLAHDDNELVGASLDRYSATNGGTYHIAGGSSDFLLLGTITESFSNGFSLTAYLNFGGPDSYERIIDFGRGQQNHNIALFREALSDNLLYGVYNEGSDKSICRANNAILNNTFAHYAVTISSSGECKMYRDGQSLVTTQTTADARPNDVSRNRNMVGKSNWSADSISNIYIGEISIYSAELSAHEVSLNLKSQTDVTRPTLITNAATVNENQRFAIDLEATETATFSISNPVTLQEFAINEITGVIEFRFNPDYEFPIDVNRFGIYEFTVRLLDSHGNTNDLPVAITIANVDEGPAFFGPTFSYSPQKGRSVSIQIATRDLSSGHFIFFMNGSKIPGCQRKRFLGGGTMNCVWRPPVTGYHYITVIFNPDQNDYDSIEKTVRVFVSHRSNRR